MVRGARRAVAALATALALAPLGACGSDGDAAEGRPTVAVTTTILGALTRDLVGDATEVRVILPNGVDPHEFRPSARDVEALGDADVIVANGLGLEEGLTDAIDSARDDGVPVLEATDVVPLLAGEEGEGGDPHVWMDPRRMRTFVGALAEKLEAEAGLRLDAPRRELERRLSALDAELARAIGRVPPDRRALVTGHESLAYYADRYGLRVVGAIVPGLSSQAEVSASRLAELEAVIAREGVPAIFAETGFPEEVADALAREAGVRVIPVATEALPEDESYATFMRAATAAFVDGLTRRAAP